MTPKERADDLFVMFYERYPDSVISNEGAKIEAKWCALRCVNEIIAAMRSEGLSGGYWEEVKQEIEKL